MKNVRVGYNSIEIVQICKTKEKKSEFGVFPIMKYNEIKYSLYPGKNFKTLIGKRIFLHLHSSPDFQIMRSLSMCEFQYPRFLFLLKFNFSLFIIMKLC